MLIASLPLLLLPALPLVQASPPTAVSGTFTSSFVVLSTSSNGGNTRSELSGTTLQAGDLVGTTTWTGHLIVHSDGSDNAQASGSFTGSLFGSASGTCSVSFNGQGQGLNVAGNIVFEHCNGGMAGVHLHGTFAGAFTSATTAAGTYSGQVT